MFVQFHASDFDPSPRNGNFEIRESSKSKNHFNQSGQIYNEGFMLHLEDINFMSMPSSEQKIHVLVQYFRSNVMPDDVYTISYYMDVQNVPYALIFGTKNFKALTKMKKVMVKTAPDSYSNTMVFKEKNHFMMPMTLASNKIDDAAVNEAGTKVLSNSAIPTRL